MSYLHDNLTGYLRDQVIAALAHWLQAQAWNFFEILGWGGIAALIAGFFLMAAVFTRLSNVLARPVPMVIAASIISLGLVFMVRGWVKTKPSRPLLATAAPVRKLPVIVPPVLPVVEAELSPFDAPPLLPATALPLIPPVAVLPSLPQPHHETPPVHHATAHAEAAHAGTPVARAPAAEHPASLPHSSGSHSAPVASGTVHVAAAGKPAASAGTAPAAVPSHVSGSSPPAQAASPAKSKPVRQPKGDTGVALDAFGGSGSAPRTASAAATARANAAAARREFQRQQDLWILKNYGTVMGGAMQGYYGGGHGTHPATGGHPAAGHPGHAGTTHHAGGHR